MNIKVTILLKGDASIDFVLPGDRYSQLRVQQEFSNARVGNNLATFTDYDGDMVTVVADQVQVFYTETVD